MIYNNFAFVFIFLPLVLFAFYLPAFRRLRVLTLVGASFIFYSLSGLEHAISLAAGIVWVFLMTRSPAIVGSTWRLVVAIIPPMLALFYYKYLGFFFENVIGLEAGQEGESFELFENIILPAGISFFTFQLIAFAIDRYRGTLPEFPDFGRFALYISFFPQLVAGPIVRYTQVNKALSRLTRFRLSSEQASAAIGYICLGLAVKVLIADTLDAHQAAYVDSPGSISTLSALYVVFAYSFQIYFDFYGYSLVAIGLGRIFGFEFPVNFRRPYEAFNPRDFWRRWHITLSYWIRDYLYMPLGGNEAYVRNILIVFFVCGLWHGAGWTFLVWGTYHGVLVILFHFTQDTWTKLPNLMQQVLTFTLVSFGWTLFIFDFQGIESFLWSLFGQAEISLPDPGLEAWMGLLIAAAVCFGLRFERMAEYISRHAVLANLRSVSFAALFTVTLLFFDRSQTFIYFRF